MEEYENCPEGVEVKWLDEDEEWFLEDEMRENEGIIVDPHVVGNY